MADINKYKNHKLFTEEGYKIMDSMQWCGTEFRIAVRYVKTAEPGDNESRTESSAHMRGSEGFWVIRDSRGEPYKKDHVLCCGYDEKTGASKFETANHPTREDALEDYNKNCWLYDVFCNHKEIDWSNEKDFW